MGAEIDEAKERAAFEAWCAKHSINPLDRGLRRIWLAAKREAAAEIAAATDLTNRLRQEAQGHAQEARTANAIIAEIYQICTGASGEPGNWNGAEPVREAIAAARKAGMLAAAEIVNGHRQELFEDGLRADLSGMSRVDCFIAGCDQERYEILQAIRASAEKV